MIILAFLFSVFGFITIMADCNMPHGTSLRIVPGVTVILVLIIFRFGIKSKRVNLKNIIFVVLAFCLIFINLMAFSDWALWATGLKTDKITLSRIKYDVEIKGVKCAKLFIVGDESNDSNLLIIKGNDGTEEKYHIELDGCIVSLIPNLRCTLFDNNTAEVDRSILSGRKFNYDLDTECNEVDGEISMEVVGMKEPDSFDAEPALLYKKIVFTEIASTHLASYKLELQSDSLGGDVWYFVDRETQRIITLYGDK